jgi:tripartite-type tricarboxylate transporter receptor subunit TctC
VNFSAGGGSDFAARAFAAFWSDVTGGAMIIKNVTGGGGTIGLQTVWDAKPDGLTLGFTHLGTPFSLQLLEGRVSEWKMEDFQWLGYMTQEPRIFLVGSHTPYETLEELKQAKGLLAPTHVLYADYALGAAIVADMLDLDMQIVPGFDGASEMILAMGRGEVDVYAPGIGEMEDLVEKGWARPPFLVIGSERSSSLSEIPAITDLAKPTTEQERYLFLFESMFRGRGPYAPPGLDMEKVNFVRDKFMEIVALNGFLRTIKVRWPYWEEPVSGEQIQSKVEKAMAIEQAEVSQIMETLIDSRAK